MQFAIILIGTTAAQACPMCAETVAADSNLPHAYMYSIIFMLTMPALVFTGFGVGIYRLIRRHEAAQAALNDDDASSSNERPVV